MKWIHSRIRACPARSSGCALPAMTSCTGRSGFDRSRSRRAGSSEQQVRSLVCREAARKAERQRSRDRRRALHLRPPPARRRRRPVAGANVRGCTRRAPCVRLRGTARAWRSGTRRMSCSSVVAVPSQRSFPQASVQRASAGGRVPGRACGLRWSRVQRALRPPASAERAARRACGSLLRAGG